MILACIIVMAFLVHVIASKLFVVQMQDVLELGAESRVNSPGSVGANWQWRMLPDAVSKDVTKKLREVTHRYRRD